MVVRDKEKVAEVFGHTRWAGYLPKEEGQPKAEEQPVLSQMFGLTENQKLHTVIAFGYPTHASRIADVEDAHDADAIKYYLDEKRDYVVPKRKLLDVVKYL